MLTPSGLVLLAGAAAVLVVLALVVVVLRRRRRPRLQVTPLAAADAERYRREFAAIEAEREDRSQQAAGRARGLVEEVLRRMGFPDRVDSAQKARDVAAYDREVARLLSQADAEIRAAGADALRLGHVVGLYRQAIEALLPRAELEDG
ncbi:MAG: hypothetical protein M3O87_06145 [Candidatus Dormibacteraeota bacterium]|nr:hypothetical protein [Candidatus Dormibacteraeota bacterium]